MLHFISFKAIFVKTGKISPAFERRRALGLVLLL